MHRLAARAARRRTGFGRTFVASGAGAAFAVSTFAVSTFAISTFAISTSSLAAGPVAFKRRTLVAGAPATELSGRPRPIAPRFVAALAALASRPAVAAALLHSIAEFTPERLHKLARSTNLVRVQFAVAVGVELLDDGRATLGVVSIGGRRSRRTDLLRSGCRRQQGRQHKAGGQS